MASGGKVLTKKAGPCGGSGGVAKDMDVTGITRIVKISVRHGAAIDAITVRFLRNGLEESTSQWGAQGGNLAEINFQPTESITSVSGHVGIINGVFVLRSLKFETNAGTYGPYGQEQGIPFELPALGGEIIGFHGRAGSFLDALGIYVKVNSTADGSTPGTWSQSDTNFWGRPVSEA